MNYSYTSYIDNPTPSLLKKNLKYNYLNDQVFNVIIHTFLYLKIIKSNKTPIYKYTQSTCLIVS